MKTCISTRFDRDNIFFDLWLKNSLKYGYDIIIFLHSDVQSISDKVSKITGNEIKVSIIDITNYGNIYKINNLEFFKKIFDILYNDLGYENIIYTDPDEILLADDINLFIKNNNNVVTSKGFELVQHKDEEFYDINKNLITQRNFGIWSHWYNKVCIFKKNNYPRSQGRHGHESKIEPLREVENKFIYLMNIRDICIFNTIENNKQNLKMYGKNHSHHSLYSIKDVEDRLSVHYYPTSIEIPHIMKEIIIKHNL